MRQAPRAWYKILSQFLLDNGFSSGKVDNTLFTLHKNDELLLVKIYVDDIIFGATNESLCDEFSKLMQKEFEISMMGELSHFLGLQIKQLKDDIFINQNKHINDMLKNIEWKVSSLQQLL